MPIYEYTCGECHEQFEKFVRSMTSDIEVKCPVCGGAHVKKGWSTFGMGGAGSGFDLAASAASNCSPGGT